MDSGIIQEDQHGFLWGELFAPSLVSQMCPCNHLLSRWFNVQRSVLVFPLPPSTKSNWYVPTRLNLPHLPALPCFSSITNTWLDGWMTPRWRKIEKYPHHVTATAPAITSGSDRQTVVFVCYLDTCCSLIFCSTLSFSSHFSSSELRRPRGAERRQREWNILLTALCHHCSATFQLADAGTEGFGG